MSGRITSLRNSYRRFAEYARPDRRYFWLDVFTIVIAVVTNTAMIWLMGKPLSLIQAGDYAALVPVLGMFAVVLLINQLAQFAGGWLSNWLGLRFIGRVRNAMVERLLYLSFPVAGQVSRGDLMARLSNDVDRLKAVWIDARLMSVSHLLTLVLYVFMLFWIDTRLALVAMATVPVFVLHQRYFSTRKRVAAEGFLQANGGLMAFEEQGLANLRGISSNSAEAPMTALHRGVFDKALHWGVRERGLDVGFTVSFTLLIYLVGLLVVLVAMQAIRSGEMPVGLLMSFLLYLGYLTVPVRGIADLFFQLAGNQPAAVRIGEVLEAQPLVPDTASGRELVVREGRILLQDVSFAYPEGPPILQHAELAIEPGATIALVGPSGSGKSTLAALLLRFYDPQQGVISVDGQDLRSVSLASLRKNIAVVWQDPFMINASVRTLLQLARAEASEAQLIEACRRSYSWTFIQQLPNGLDTQLGAGGVELSGGQKQRLAIAQAHLRDAPILILDEASSALDSQAEQAIVRELDALRAGRTTLIIAHRYSSIRSADKVVYFEGDGSLTVGTHDELLQSHPAYRQAVDWQTGQGEEKNLGA